MLGHYLNEYLANSVHLSQTDPVMADLVDEDPQPLTGLMRQVRSQLRCGQKVVFSARLATSKQKERVLQVARDVGAPRLLVEIEGTDPATLERATKIADTLAEIRDLLEDLRTLISDYSTLTPGEQDRVPTVSVPAEEPVEEQIKAVLDSWGRLGAACE